MRGVSPRDTHEGKAVTCPLCEGLVPLPAEHEPAVCEPCGVVFQPVAEIGWFNAPITVYALEP